MHTPFWLQNLKGKDCMEDLKIDWEDTIEMDLEEMGI
jgi:hypothetical protein